MRYMSFFIVSFCIQRFTCGFFNYCILFLIYILFIIFICYYYNNISSLLSLHFNKCCNSSLFTFYLRSYSINRFPYLLLKPFVSSKTFLQHFTKITNKNGLLFSLANFRFTLIKNCSTAVYMLQLIKIRLTMVHFPGETLYFP